MKKTITIWLMLAGSAFAQVSVPINGSLGISVPNDPTVGTTLGYLTKLTTSGAAVTVSTSDTSGIFGCAAMPGTPGKSGSITIANEGLVQCVADGTMTGGDFVVNSPTVAGQVHDYGPTIPTGTQCIGRVATPAAGIGGIYLIVWGKCGAAPGGGSSAPTANVTNLGTPGVGNSDGQTNVYLNGVLKTNLTSSFMPDILAAFANTSVCLVNGVQYSDPTGLDCAYAKAVNYSFTTTGHPPGNVILGTGKYVANYTLDLHPTNATVNLYGPSFLTCEVDAGAAMVSLVKATGGSPVVEGCYFNGKHLAQGVLNFVNTGYINLSRISYNYNDYVNGNGNSNVPFSCVGCGDATLKTIIGASGNTDHYGKKPNIVANVTSGSISSLTFLYLGESLTVSNGGTGATATGSFPVTVSANGTHICVNYPLLPNVTVTTIGGGYTTGTFPSNYTGFGCTDAGPYTLTIGGTSGVTGQTISMLADTGGTGFGTTADSEGLIAPVVAQYFGTQAGYMGCTVAPARYQGTNPGGAYYNLQKAGLLVNPPVITYDSSNRPISASLYDTSVTSTGSGCVGPIYLDLDTGNPVDRNMVLSGPDATWDDFHVTGGLHASIDIIGSGQKSVNGLHVQGGPLSLTAATRMTNTELDGTGLEVYSGAAVIDGVQSTYNNTSNYPGARELYIATNNSSNNGSYLNWISGAPGDTADFVPIVTVNGPVNGGAAFAVGTIVQNWRHLGNEVGRLVSIAAENATVRASINAQQNLTLTTTGTGAATLSNGALNIPVATGSGSGTVNSGNAFAPAYYPSSTTAVSSPTAFNGPVIASTTAAPTGPTGTCSGAASYIDALGACHAASAIGTTAQIPVYPGSGGAAVPQTISGDSTLTASGVMTNIGINTVQFSALTNGLLRNTTGTGQPSIETTAQLATDAQTALKTSTNCNTSNGYYYSPFSGTCVLAATGTITALTGDVTASGSGSVVATLASVGTAGTYGSATQVPVITTDGKGRVAAVTNTTISAPLATVVTLTGATPAITAGPFVFYNETLTAATAPTISGIVAGQTLKFHICQGSTAYAYTWPTAFRSPPTIDATSPPNSCVNAEFISLDGTTITPIAVTVNVTP